MYESIRRDEFRADKSQGVPWRSGGRKQLRPMFCIMTLDAHVTISLEGCLGGVTKVNEGYVHYPAASNPVSFWPTKRTSPTCCTV
ncbi:hypothetical protein IG631_17051 [Alternaria alternata]|nr:hypothetical protein IG631_17051 [Alternaria alternata]